MLLTNFLKGLKSISSIVFFIIYLLLPYLHRGNIDFFEKSGSSNYDYTIKKWNNKRKTRIFKYLLSRKYLIFK